MKLYKMNGRIVFINPDHITMVSPIERGTGYWHLVIEMIDGTAVDTAVNMSATQAEQMAEKLTAGKGERA